MVEAPVNVMPSRAQNRNQNPNQDQNLWCSVLAMISSCSALERSQK